VWCAGADVCHQCLRLCHTPSTQVVDDQVEPRLTGDVTQRRQDLRKGGGRTVAYVFSLTGRSTRRHQLHSAHSTG
jgi:hypothetical protein